MSVDRRVFRPYAPTDARTEWTRGGVCISLPLPPTRVQIGASYRLLLAAVASCSSPERVRKPAMARDVALIFVIGVIAYACFWMAWHWF